MAGIVVNVGAEKWLTVRCNGMVFNWSGRDLEKLDDKHSQAYRNSGISALRGPYINHGINL